MSNYLDLFGTGPVTAATARAVLGCNRKNAIINGDFDIWQRGTSFAAIADGTYSADRMLYRNGSSAAHTISRDTDIPTVAQSGHLSNYSFKIDCTTADSSIAATDYCYVVHRIEGYNFKRIAQQAFTLSFWVKATKTGIYCISLRNTGNDRSYVAEYTINSTDTWEKKIINVSASPSAGTWDYVNGVGLKVTWVLNSGSNYHTTKDAWQTGSYIATSNQVNGTDSTDNNFWLSQVQIEIGSVATEFEVRDIGVEEILCKRYFQKSYEMSVAPGTSDTDGTVGGGAQTMDDGSYFNCIVLPVPMRSNPTVKYYRADGTADSWSGKCETTGPITPTMTTLYTGPNNFMAYSSAAAPNWAGCYLTGHYTAESEL